MTITPLRALPLDELRKRTSAKWRAYPGDVLPLFVAETDFALAPAITRVLSEAVERGDTGYTAGGHDLPEAFAAFAQRRMAWSVDPAQVRTTADVCMGIVEILRRVISPGDEVIVTTPVYPPFFDVIPEAGGVVRRVPLRDRGDGWELDLAGIEDALRAGVKAVLLCNPHNPTGTAHAKSTLAALASLAVRYGAVVVSDEIHAPLAAADSGFSPFLSVSDESRAVGFALTSASKAFNLAGLKCAVIVTASEASRQVIASLPDEVFWRTGHFGALAARAAFSEESDAWLDGLLQTLDENRRLVGELVGSVFPEAGYRIPDAGYLAWIDLGRAGLGDDPGRRILTDARVALSNGPTFGEEGAGYVRVNFGTSPEILREAFSRIAALRARP